MQYTYLGLSWPTITRQIQDPISMHADHSTVKKWGVPKHPWGTMFSWLLKKIKGCF